MKRVTSLHCGACTSGSRLVSLDVYRGLVMLLLIPDVHGGFSFYKMAQLSPDDPVWAFLSSLFTHANWGGCTLWDMIMPSFLFVLGVAIPYSYAARKGRGEPESSIYVHATLRAFTLLTLGILLVMPVRSEVDLLWPLLLLTAGMPVFRSLIGRTRFADTLRVQKTADLLWWVVLLSFTIVHVTLNLERLGGPALHDILPQIGLAYVFAFLLVNRSRFAQAGIILAILFAYGLAFLVYPIQDAPAPGVLATDEIFVGHFAHWNKNANLAAAFDVWFLNLFPRLEPYLFQSHGYQTLNFIPSIASITIGVMTGQYLRMNTATTDRTMRLLAAGLVVAAAGWFAGMWCCPIVKSIWTPSWTLFSSGLAIMTMAVLYYAIDVRGWQRWAFPLVVAGANPILLYTLAAYYRWWVIGVEKRVLSPILPIGIWTPLFEALLFGFTLWTLAFLLYRRRLFVRI